MKAPYISVIISAYNNIEWLHMILVALEHQTHKDFEVVVADDGSNTEVVSILNKIIASSPLQVTHVWHEDRGWQKNIILNRAIVAAQGKYLIFIDGDCVPHARMVEEHFHCRQAERIIAGRRVQLTESLSAQMSVTKVRSKWHQRLFIPLFYAGIRGKERHVEECVRITNPYLRKWFVRDRYKDLLGCNFSIYKSDILKVNGFDERYLHPATGEDTDLEARLRRIGIIPVKKKHLLTVYHRKHFRKEVENDPNIAIFEENNAQDVSWTPYGIIKK